MAAAIKLLDRPDNATGFSPYEMTSGTGSDPGIPIQDHLWRTRVASPNLTTSDHG